jgi:ABC-type dipeptide/oligopeptide/nickel transport system permease component
MQMPTLGRILVRSVLVLLISGILGATLVRIAPGFDTDERFLDPRFSRATLEALRRERDPAGPFGYYCKFLTGLARGDGGHSIVFGQPVGVLIRHRVPVTLRTVGWGLALGWTAGLMFAIGAAMIEWSPPCIAATAISTFLLCIPSALLATACMIFRLPPAAAITAVIFPRVFAFCFAQMRAMKAKPHVLMARARGTPASRVLVFHVVPATLWPTIALLAVSAPLAFAAAIPVEALADSPGLGQLAWKAALGRDLQVLVCITMLFTAATVIANAGADLFTVWRRRGLS